MLNFELYIPTKLYFGRGQCDRVGEIAAGRGFRRALICYGGGSAVRSGLLERIKTSLDAAGVCVAWCLRHGVLPAGRETTPMTANVPDPFRA